MNPARLFPILALVVCSCSQPPEDPFPEPAERPSVQARLSNPSPKAGEPVELHLRLRGDQRFVIPPPGDLLDPAIELLESETSEATLETGWQRDIRMDVAVYAVTNVTVFAQNNITTLSDPPQALNLPFLSLEITPTLEGDSPVPKLGNTDLPDFRGPEALARRKRNLLISIGVLIALLLTAAFIVWRIARRPPPPPPPVDWKVLARKDMKALQETDIWQKPDVEASTVALSQILRRFIEGRFGIHAPERTTEEFLLEVQELKPWPEEQTTGLRDFFTAADRIKFAGERPGRETLDHLMGAAESFVDTTPRREVSS